MKVKVHTRAMRATMALALGAGVASAAQAAPTVQSTSPAGENSYGWTWDSLGQVSFASGTNKVLALTSQVTLVDQGWGGQDPGSNAVFMSLDVDGNSVWNRWVAGAYHYATTQNFDIASDPASLSALYGLLSAINWSTNPDVQLSMRQRGLGYGGWELHTSNAFFSVTSDVTGAVPEPATWAMMLVGFGVAGYAMRRRQKVAATVRFA